MLLCPSCTETLEKNEKHGEGVWQCPNEDCGIVWFIVDIPRPKYLMNKSEQKKKKVKPKKHP